MERPRVRFVEAIPIEQEGEVFVVLRDPTGVCEQQAVVPPATVVVLSLMDGTRTVEEIQTELTRATQAVVPQEDLRGLIGQLDEIYLLDNERARLRHEEIEREYLALPARPAIHAGVSYPEDAQELIDTLDGFSAREMPELHPTPPLMNGSKLPAQTPRGLVLPHIDFRCGGAAMCNGLRSLRLAEPPDVYVILGVAHHPTQNLYTLSEKDFETPLGTVRADAPAIDILRSHYGADRLRGELAHKHEHSVEFATVLLKYLHRDRKDFTIVPVLCGSLHEELERDEDQPWPPPEVEQFCEALRTMAERLEKRVCIVASVDLSHVGRKFGDEQGVDDFRAGMVRAADLRMLETVGQRDPEAWFDHFREDGNARNVDAVTAIYTQLKVLGGGETHLTCYDQYRELETDSMVTFASLTLY